MKHLLNIFAQPFNMIFSIFDSDSYRVISKKYYQMCDLDIKIQLLKSEEKLLSRLIMSGFTGGRDLLNRVNRLKDIRKELKNLENG